MLIDSRNQESGASEQFGASKEKSGSKQSDASRKVHRQRDQGDRGVIGHESAKTPSESLASLDLRAPKTPPDIAVSLEEQAPKTPPVTLASWETRTPKTPSEILAALYATLHRCGVSIILTQMDDLLEEESFIEVLLFLFLRTFLKRRLGTLIFSALF